MADAISWGGRRIKVIDNGDDSFSLAVSAASATTTAGTTHFDSGTFTTLAGTLNGGTSLACQAVLIQADPDNTDDLLVGNTDNQPIQMVPGEAHTFPGTDVNQFVVKTVSGNQTANWASG